VNPAKIIISRSISLSQGHELPHKKSNRKESLPQTRNRDEKEQKSLLKKEKTGGGKGAGVLLAYGEVGLMPDSLKQKLISKMNFRTYSFTSSCVLLSCQPCNVGVFELSFPLRRESYSSVIPRTLSGNHN